MRRNEKRSLLELPPKKKDIVARYPNSKGIVASIHILRRYRWQYSHTELKRNIGGNIPTVNCVEKIYWDNIVNFKR